MRPRFCIVMELCEQGTLLDVLKKENLFWDWDKTFDILRYHEAKLSFNFNQLTVDKGK